jgi:hypothetical protein
MMQNPVAANHTIAAPTNPVNRSHQVCMKYRFEPLGAARPSIGVKANR